YHFNVIFRFHPRNDQEIIVFGKAFLNQVLLIWFSGYFGAICYKSTWYIILALEIFLNRGRIRHEIVAEFHGKTFRIKQKPSHTSLVLCPFPFQPIHIDDDGSVFWE